MSTKRFATRSTTKKWGFAAESCLITGEGAGVPAAVVVVVAPTLGVSTGGGNVSVTFPSATGVSYQVQSSLILPAPSWTNEGAPLAGTGGTLTFSTSTAGAARFFRVVAQ